MKTTSSSISYPVPPAAVGRTAPPLPFSLATQVGNLIFVSGQASTDESGKIVPGSFEEEFRRTLENLRGIVEAAGSSLDRVVQVRAYLRDGSNWADYNRLYGEYFSEPFPARTTLTNCLPDTIQFELECIAVVSD